jgi:hypothetical protein
MRYLRSDSSCAARFEHDWAGHQNQGNDGATMVMGLVRLDVGCYSEVGREMSCRRKLARQ